MECFNEAQGSFIVSTIFSACATGYQHMFKFGSTALVYNLSQLRTARVVTSDEWTFVMMPVTAYYFPIIPFVSLLLCTPLWLYKQSIIKTDLPGLFGVRCLQNRPRKRCSWAADGEEMSILTARCLMTAILRLGALGWEGGVPPGSTWTWPEKMRSVLKDEVLPLGLLRKHQFLLLLGLVLAPLQNSYQNYHEAAVGRKTAEDPRTQIIKIGFNKSRNPSTAVKTACLMSQLAPMFECMQGRSFGANMWRVWIIFTRRVLKSRVAVVQLQSCGAAECSSGNLGRTKRHQQ